MKISTLLIFNMLNANWADWTDYTDIYKNQFKSARFAQSAFKTRSVSDFLNSWQNRENQIRFQV